MADDRPPPQPTQPPANPTLPPVTAEPTPEAVADADRPPPQRPQRPQPTQPPANPKLPPVTTEPTPEAVADRPPPQPTEPHANPELLPPLIAEPKTALVNPYVTGPGMKGSLVMNWFTLTSSACHDQKRAIAGPFGSQCSISRTTTVSSSTTVSSPTASSPSAIMRKYRAIEDSNSQATTATTISSPTTVSPTATTSSPTATTRTNSNYLLTNIYWQ